MRSVTRASSRQGIRALSAFFVIAMSPFPAAAEQVASTAPPAQVSGKATPIAQLSPGFVRRPGLPSVEIKVPVTATYLGAERFTLYDVADCEIHLFVDVDANRRVRRLYWVQFEEYLPHLQHQYKYAEDSERQDHWGQGVWVRSRFYPSNIETRPGSDFDKMRSMVKRAGYELPPYLMYVRFIRLLDEKGRSGEGKREVMMIYAEDMVGAGFDPDDYITGDDINEKWAPHRQSLIARGARAVEIRVL